MAAVTFPFLICTHLMMYCGVKCNEEYEQGVVSIKNSSIDNDLTRIYANYYEHCGGSPSYFLEQNQKFVIHGSVPSVESAAAPRTEDETAGGYDETSHHPVKEWTSYFYLSPVCLFTLTGPRFKYLHLTFADPTNCNLWPPGCSITIWNGNYKTDPRNAPIMLSLPAPLKMMTNNNETSNSSSSHRNSSYEKDPTLLSESWCSFDAFSASNVLTFRVNSCMPTPTSNFNFTVVVFPSRTNKAVSKTTESSSSSVAALNYSLVYVLLLLIAFLVTLGFVTLRLLSPSPGGKRRLVLILERFCCCGYYFFTVGAANYIAPAPCSTASCSSQQLKKLANNVDSPSSSSSRQGYYGGLAASSTITNNGSDTARTIVLNAGESLFISGRQRASKVHPENEQPMAFDELIAVAQSGDDVFQQPKQPPSSLRQIISDTL